MKSSKSSVQGILWGMVSVLIEQRGPIFLFHDG